MSKGAYKRYRQDEKTKQEAEKKSVIIQRQFLCLAKKLQLKLLKKLLK